MDFNIVHAAGLWVKAPRLLDTSKTWEVGKYDENSMTHVHFSPKKDSESSPTAQTREGTTLLMWFKLEECGLVEGSESQDLGNYQDAVTGSTGRHSD
jgi:hypothetical protein